MKHMISNKSKVPGIMLNAWSVSNIVAIIGKNNPHSSLWSSTFTNVSMAIKYDVAHNALGKQYIIKSEGFETELKSRI